MTRFFDRLLWGAIGLWFCMAVVRSVVHGQRIAAEFAQGSQLYHPEISLCEVTDNLTTEQRYVANYRSLGVKCQE